MKLSTKIAALAAAILIPLATATAQTNAPKPTEPPAVIELLHTGTSTKHLEATPEQIAEMKARLAANKKPWKIPSDATTSPKPKLNIKPDSPRKGWRPTVVNYISPECTYIPFYSWEWLEGTLVTDPSNNLPACVAQSTTLGTINGYPNSSSFAASWTAVFSNDGLEEAIDEQTLTSGCGPSFGPITVQWETYNTLSPGGLPAFAISANVYDASDSLILVGSWITYYTTATGFGTTGGSVPAGGITCPAN